MEEILSSETSELTYQTTITCHNPEDYNMDLHCRGDLEYYAKLEITSSSLKLLPSGI
jgi:hypothetical protein